MFWIDQFHKAEEYVIIAWKAFPYVWAWFWLESILKIK